MSYKHNFFNKKQTDKAYDKLVSREIANFKGKLIATGEINELYANMLEVNTFQFLEMTIIGALNINLREAVKSPHRICHATWSV